MLGKARELMIPLLREKSGLGKRGLVGDDGRRVTGRKIYIAARYSRREELIPLARELQQAGAAVTCRWLFAEGGALVGEDFSPEGRGGTLAAIDFEDVQGADICLAFTENGDGPPGRGGRHTELGIALALGRRVILVGPREHVFHCLPQIEHFETWAAARDHLGLLPAPAPLPVRSEPVAADAAVSLSA